MEWLCERLTDLFRPWHDNRLPEELAFGEIVSWGFIRGGMARTARLAVDLDVDFGVFAIIGIECAPRAASAWRPRERLLMEDISCAFSPLSRRVTAREFVPPIHQERLVFLLGEYFAYIGAPRPETELRAALERYIEEAPTAP